MNEELRNLLALVFSAGGFVGYIKARIKDLADRISRLEKVEEDK